MKQRRSLVLRRETMVELRTDELGQIAGGDTPTCPIRLSDGATGCESFPILECLVSGAPCNLTRPVH